MPFAASEILGKAPAVWLFEMDLDGAVYRFATRESSVTDAAGTTRLYTLGLGALEVDLDDDAAARSVAITISASVDWALLVARGLDLRLRPCTLRRWYTGLVLERADVVLRGRIDSPSYGSVQEPLTFAVVREATRNADDIPGSQRVVDTSTQPAGTIGGEEVSSRADGAVYPIIIGSPGHDPNFANPHPAVPALATSYNDAASGRLLVCDRAVDAGNCWLYNLTTRLSATQITETKDDLLGQETAEVPFTGPHAALGAIDDEYWIGLQDDATYGRGIVHRGAGIRGVGEVLEWLVDDHFHWQWDRGRMAAAADWLNRFKVDTYINARVNAWTWFESEILRWLQVAVIDGQDGTYIQPLRYDATSQDAVMWLDADRGNVQRASQVTYRPDAVFNELTLQYRPVRSTGNYYSRRVLTAQSGQLTREIGAATDERVWGSYLCARSQALFANREQYDAGVRPWTGDVRWCWDDPTAGLILQGLAERYALPKRTVRYVGGRELETLDKGAVVVLDDDEVALSAAVALVDRRVVSVDQVAIDLLLLDHPVSNTVSIV